MNLYINGKERQVAPGLTIGALLEQLELQPERVVLELNREILNAQNALELQLNPQDRLEIIQFVGGG